MPNAVEIQSASSSLAIVSLVGDHGLSDVTSLRVVFARAAIRAPNVIADLSRCSFADSTVIEVLIHAQTIITKDHGRFAVALPEEPNAVSRLAQLVHLSELMPTYASLAEALASFDESPVAVPGLGRRATA